MLEEWIGRRASVMDAPNPAHAGLAGTIVDETAQTLVLRLADGREARVPKKGARLRLADGPGPNTVIDANQALMRPEDRTKRLYRKCMQK